MEVINYLLGYEGLSIVQDTDKFHFSLDSVLLPNFVTLNSRIKNILDIGCGNAPISLILSTKCNANIVGIEIQKSVYEMALRSVQINKLEEKISLLNEDVNDYAQRMESDYFDVIVCNPPFFKVGEGSKFNDNEYLTIARHEKKLNLNQIFKISRKLLKNNGVFAMVHRPERLLDILMTMRLYNIEPKRIQLIYPKVGKDANILLIEGRKNGKAGLKVLPPLYTHNENGDYTDQVKKYFVD